MRFLLRVLGAAPCEICGAPTLAEYECRRHRDVSTLWPQPRRAHAAARHHSPAAIPAAEHERGKPGSREPCEAAQ